jgi:DNA-binding CsgD family transcriptional regulator
LGAAVDFAQASLLYEESGGNPFYLEQLARTMDRARARVVSSHISPTAFEVPSGVAASVREELTLLSESARLLLRGAAVAGDPFELELAAAATGTASDLTLDALDELLHLEVVRPTDAPRRFRFRHPLLRRAAYEDTPSGWRLRAHERCAQALAARGSPAAARARHVERSARQGDLEAVAILREAGEATSRLAPAIASRWFGAALRLLPETTPGEERVALLLSLARCLAAAGQFAESRAHLLECIDIAARDAPDWRVRVSTTCASVEHLMGLQKEARTHLATALSELTESESADAVELMIELCVDGYNAGDFGAMHFWAERAVAGAMPLGDRSLLAAALAARAWSTAHARPGEQAQLDCDQATELVDELSDAEVSIRLDTLAYLTSAEQYLDRFQASTRHGQRALQIGRATGQGEQFPRIAAMLGGALWIQGRVSEAGDLFDGAVESARLSGNVRSLAWMLFNRCLAALAAGKLDLALTTGEEGLELMEAMEPGPSSAFAAAALASARFESGDAQACVELLLTKAGGETLSWIGGGWRARFLEVLTRGLLVIGRRSDAERAAVAAQACADEVALPSALAMANIAAAALTLDRNEPATAAERAVAAVAELESVSAWFDAARARVLAGRAFAQAGDRIRAAFEFELAAAAFDSFDSFRYRDEAERELRKLGRRIHRQARSGSRTQSGITALTARELEIAQLVVDRKTNAEIAAELFLSQKTVETHLRNIFDKMGLRTRVELARAVERGERARSRQT